MLLAEKYKDWFLPKLLEVPEWKEFIDVLIDEIVTLQKYNMGSYNDWGFNGVEEGVSLETPNEWLIGKNYAPTKGESESGGSFSLVDGSLIFDNSVEDDSIAALPYTFVKDREYVITFEVLDLTGAVELLISMGGTVEVLVLEERKYELRMTAEDFYFYFKVLDGASGTFRIKDLQFVGVINSTDDEERTLVLRRLVDVDNASREILERYRDSLSFPAIENMPETLLRQVVKDHNKFVGLSGSQLASSMFFYFLGYEVEFSYLYAHKTDYNSNRFAYISQVYDDILVSVPGVKVWAQAAKSVGSSYSVELYPGHEVIAGDFLINQTHPFGVGLVEVLTVEGDVLGLAEPVTVTKDDLFDLYRVYPYAVNPDPENYLKTSHIDVFFKQKYLNGVDLDFSKLEQFFLNYLPVNVVIRFFGYKTQLDDEYFAMREAAFIQKEDKSESFQLVENTVVPEQDFAIVVYDNVPETHEDINGDMVNGYSYAIKHTDPATGEIVYVAIPLT